MKLTYNNQKLTAHIYNTTQKIKVDGKGHSKFVEKILEPHFTSSTNSHKNEISNYNKEIIESLSTKLVTRSNIKLRAGSVHTCTHCDFTSKTSTQLKKHINTHHTDLTNISASNSIQSSSSRKYLQGPKQSTRENSLCIQMNEDTSLLSDEVEDITNDLISNKKGITLEEVELTELVKVDQLIGDKTSTLEETET